MFRTVKDVIAVTVYRIMKNATEPFEENRFSHPFFRVSKILNKVPLAANPKSAILMTIKERWFHWLMENTLIRSTSKVIEESDRKKTAKKIIGYCLSWRSRES
jgi:hypothetical protein